MTLGAGPARPLAFCRPGPRLAAGGSTAGESSRRHGDRDLVGPATRTQVSKPKMFEKGKLEMAKMKMPHTRTALAIFAPHFQLSRPTLAPLLHVSRRPSRHSLAPHSPASRRTLRRRTLAPHSQVSHRPPTFLPPTPFSPRSFLTPLLSPAPASRRLDGIMIGAVSGSSVPGASFRPNPVGPDRRGSSASDAPEAPRPVPEFRRARIGPIGRSVRSRFTRWGGPSPAFQARFRRFRLLF